MSRDLPDDDELDLMIRRAQSLGMMGPLTDNRGTEIEKLIDRLGVAMRDWDTVYPEVVQDADNRSIKLTEEKLRIATRNEMRERNMELPEIVRWKLRAILGGVEGHE